MQLNIGEYLVSFIVVQNNQKLSGFVSQYWLIVLYLELGAILYVDEYYKPRNLFKNENRNMFFLILYYIGGYVCNMEMVSDHVNCEHIHQRNYLQCHSTITNCGCVSHYMYLSLKVFYNCFLQNDAQKAKLQSICYFIKFNPPDCIKWHDMLEK